MTEEKTLDLIDEVIAELEVLIHRLRVKRDEQKETRRNAPG